MTPLPWQQGLAQRLTGLVRSGRLPHGVLITAADGWGETEFLQWLTLHLLEVGPDRDPRELAHPDLRWLVPDGAVLKVDAIREASEFAFTTRQMAPVKVIVIQDAHLMNRNAANALLKTLEEPPAATHLLLASCHPGRLPATVASRCQRFAIRPDGKAARGWLAQRWPGADVDARLLANGGAPLLVARELKQELPPLADGLRSLLRGNAPASGIDTLLARDPDQLTGGWYRYVGAQLAGRSPFPELAETPPRRLLHFADELLWVRHQLLTSNSANARLLLERLVTKWHALPGTAGKP